MGYGKQAYISHGFEAGSQRAGCQILYWVADWVGSELGHWGLFYQGTAPIHEGPTHDPIIPKAPSPCGFRSQCTNLRGGDTNIQTM